MKRIGMLLSLLLTVLLVGCSASAGPASLQNLQVGAPTQYLPENCTSGGPAGFEPLPGGGEVLVGENDHTSGIPGNGECTVETHRYEARIRFSLSGNAVTRATLRYRLLSSEPAGGGGPISCADALKLATDSWGSATWYGLTRANEYIRLPYVAFPTLPDEMPSGVQIDVQAQTFKVDVTSAVNNWLNGQTANNGFVLTTAQEHDSLNCLSRYTDFALTLEA